MSEDTRNRPRRPLSETVCDIDREILRLLLRRSNLLARMAAPKKRIAPREERLLRESWEAQVARVSTDPNLSGRFFALMQEVEFLPKPDEEAAPRRTAFNLQPSRSPVRLSMAAPTDGRETRLWAALAAASGQPLRIEQALMNDAVVDCLRMLDQTGASIRRDGDTLTALQGAPAGTPDKIIHVGDSAFNFHLCLAFYLGRPSRAKFSGGSSLKMADFSAIRHFLPGLQARLIPLMPRSDGLPVRLECAGMLPDTIVLPGDLPPDFAACLLLAAPFYGKPVTLDMSALPETETAAECARVLSVLAQAKIRPEQEGRIFRVRPARPRIPPTPRLSMDLGTAGVLLSLAAACRGRVRLTGCWPDTESARALTLLFRQLGLDPRANGEGVLLEVPEDSTLNTGRLSIPRGLSPEYLPLAAALLCLQALRCGRAELPDEVFREPGALPELDGLARACGLVLEDEALVRPAGPVESLPPWTAPSPLWACALALAACARPVASQGFGLVNPGVLTALYPSFWAIYNALPAPELTPAEPAQPEPVKERRRIRTTQPARLTPRPVDED